MEKVCGTCKLTKSLEEFNHSSVTPSGLRSSCRACQSKESKIYYDANREKVNRRNAEQYRLSRYGSITAKGPGPGRWGARPREGLPTSLSAEERQVIIGSLLGDGSMTMYKRSLFPAFRERHALAQGEYLRWKAQLLTRLQPYVREHNAVVAGKTQPGLFLSTPQVPALKKFMAFYGDGHKIIPNFALQELGLLGLAILIQDDGQLISVDERKGLHHPYMEIHSQSFSKEDNTRLRDRIREILVSSKVNVVKRASGTGWGLLLGVDATFAVASFCARYWHSSMAYKFPYPEFLNGRSP